MEAGEGWVRDGVGKREVGRCWGAMTTISNCLFTFIRFIQLKSLSKRTEEEYVR